MFCPLPLMAVHCLVAASRVRVEEGRPNRQCAVAELGLGRLQVRAWAHVCKWLG